jgi:molecular chaperone GrpE (heat shock protein)
MEEAVASYLSGKAPSPETLEPFLVQATRILDMMTRFRQEASAVAPRESNTKLAPVITDLRQFRNELEQLLAGAAENRLRLSFTAEFSTMQETRQTLMQSIASGLQREVIKLDNLPEACAKRLSLLASRASAEAADFADAVLDVDRNNSSIQGALQAVFQACQVEEIAPRKNDPFLAKDHSMVQMMRRFGGDDRTGTVAQLVTRGLRQGDRVIRKAAVIVFE